MSEGADETKTKPVPSLSLELSDDWATQTADAIERAVGTVREKTAVPLDEVARKIVYGLLASMLLVSALILTTIGFIRGLDEVLPEDVWAAYAVLGGIFTLVGLFLWTKRR